MLKKLYYLFFVTNFTVVNLNSYLKEAAEVLATQYNSDIPSTVEDLMKLKGVGPKMAYLCLTCAWGK